jgi:transposase-like protein
MEKVTNDYLRKKKMYCKKCGNNEKMPFIGVNEKGEEKFQCPKCFSVYEIKG